MVNLFLAAFSIILLIFSAFFSAAETGLVTLSPQKAKSLAVRTPRLAHALIAWLSRPHELLTTILVMNTFVNVLFAAAISFLALRSFPSVTQSTIEIYAWLSGTVLVVLCGEITPKVFARSNPERTSLFALPLLSRIRTLVSPFIFAVDVISRFFFPRSKSLGTGDPTFTFSMEELRGLLEEDEAASLQKSEAVDMMKRILDLENRVVESIMVPWSKVDFLELDPGGLKITDRNLLIDLIIEFGHTRTPIKFKGKVIGFIHSYDLMPLMVSDHGEDIREYIRPLMEISPQRRVFDLLQDFQESGVNIGIVMNPAREPLGIVTLEDVLEEITGEILDEYDLLQPPPEEKPQ